MIVLSENPLDDISNTKKIEAVINNGQIDRVGAINSSQSVSTTLLSLN
jgi:hypothetical protein